MDCAGRRKKEDEPPGARSIENGRRPRPSDGSRSHLVSWRRRSGPTKMAFFAAKGPALGRPLPVWRIQPRLTPLAPQNGRDPRPGEAAAWFGSPRIGSESEAALK